jgi:hypothetical protein
MRARVLDPVGPLRFRALPWLLGPLTFLLACFLPLGDVASFSMFVASGALFCVTPFIPFRGKPHEAELVFRPGAVEIKKAGRANQKIRAKDILGATTALVPDGVLLTLNHKKRKSVPIQMIVKDLESVKKVRDALGIGHDGFGTVFFPTDSRAAETGDGVLRGLSLIGFIAAFIARVAGESSDLYMTLAVLSIIGGVIGLLIKASGASAVAPYVAMRADGVHVFGSAGWRVIPYASIANIDERPEGLMISLHGYPPVLVPAKATRFMYHGMSVEERKLAIAQILSASQRAHGAAPPKPNVTTRVDVLKRNGEAARSWLARLDVAAQTVGNAGYRGGQIEEQDLWTILEDPDGEVEMRAASARVLRNRGPDARARVETIVGAVRQDAAQKRIRIALEDDIEAAGQQMEALEQEEMRKMIVR